MAEVLEDRLRLHVRVAGADPQEVTRCVAFLRRGEGERVALQARHHGLALEADVRPWRPGEAADCLAFVVEATSDPGEDLAAWKRLGEAALGSPVVRIVGGLEHPIARSFEELELDLGEVLGLKGAPVRWLPRGPLPVQRLWSLTSDKERYEHGDEAHLLLVDPRSPGATCEVLVLADGVLRPSLTLDLDPRGVATASLRLDAARFEVSLAGEPWEPLRLSTREAPSRPTPRGRPAERLDLDLSASAEQGHATLRLAAGSPDRPATVHLLVQERWVIAGQDAQEVLDARLNRGEGTPAPLGDSLPGAASLEEIAQWLAAGLPLARPETAPRDARAQQAAPLPLQAQPAAPDSEGLFGGIVEGIKDLLGLDEEVVKITGSVSPPQTRSPKASPLRPRPASAPAPDPLLPPLPPGAQANLRAPECPHGVHVVHHRSRPDPSDPSLTVSFKTVLWGAPGAGKASVLKVLQVLDQQATGGRPALARLPDEDGPVHLLRRSAVEHGWVRKEFLHAASATAPDPASLPLVLAWNKRDLPHALPCEALDKALNPFNAPTFETVATTGEGIGPAWEKLRQMILEPVARTPEGLRPRPSPVGRRTLLAEAFEVAGEREVTCPLPDDVADLAVRAFAVRGLTWTSKALRVEVS